MSGVNKVILIGRLGKDPETRVFENGGKKVSFTLATSEVYKDKDGNRREVTEWHNVVCWRLLADIAEKYFTKGKLLYVEGRLRTRMWEENGVKKYFTEIEATSITMLGSKNDGKPTEHKEEQAEPVSFTDTAAPVPGDDFPF
ncbi:MAG: single-stranded DNA-binding protein [Bacteroidales bacterium]|nr:single-stranded DNA-binding protein [Bacteroidales bacterium]